MFDIGGGELLLILIVVLIAFGPKKLPELAQSLGRGLKEFKRAQRDFAEQINSAIETENRRQTKTVSRKPPTMVQPEPVAAPTEQPQHPALEQPGESLPTIQPPVGARTARIEAPPIEEPPVQHPIESASRSIDDQERQAQG